MDFIIVLLFSKDFDDTIVLGGPVATPPNEAEVISAGRRVGEVGIPEVFFFAYVADLVNYMSPTVVDGQFVVGVLAVLNQVFDAEVVVHTVVVRGDDIGELQGGGHYLDGVESGVGTVDVVPGDAYIVLGEDEPHEVGGGEVHPFDVPTIDGVGLAGSV